jgi:phosphomethylpyrimidine synthase
MTTQLELAQKGEITPAMRSVAEKEKIGVETIAQSVAEGSVVIPANINHRGLEPCGIGKGLRTKVNANIGTSADYASLDSEISKLRLLTESGADTVMDLSTGGDLDHTRRTLIEATALPLGTVPIYQAAIAAIERRGSIVELTADDLFEAIEAHARDGVDFITVHCGVTQSSIARLQQQGRVVDIVSRGGSFLTGWILHNDKENPLYERYDRLLAIAKEHDVTLSLGDGLRPGGIADATDRAQIEELITLGELVARARDAGVQVMVEGPGHVPLDQVAANVQMEKQLCQGAPFYVLGPLVTDVAAGYDHITAAIGGALAAASGADFLCYVTPAEHLSLPSEEDVKIGVIAARIAAHAADIAKGVKGAWEWDREMSVARKNLDWERQAQLSIDPERSQQGHGQYQSESQACSMCGPYCAMDLVSQYLGVDAVRC